MTDPTSRYNFRVGDQVLVGWPPSSAMEVTDTSDRALLILQKPGGAQLRVGRLACVLVQTGNDSTHNTQETTP